MTSKSPVGKPSTLFTDDEESEPEKNIHAFVERVSPLPGAFVENSFEEENSLPSSDSEDDVQIIKEIPKTSSVLKLNRRWGRTPKPSVIVPPSYSVNSSFRSKLLGTNSSASFCQGRIGKTRRKSALQQCVDLAEKDRYLYLLETLSGSKLGEDSPSFTFASSYRLNRDPLHNEDESSRNIIGSSKSSPVKTSGSFSDYIRDAKSVLDELASPIRGMKLENDDKQKEGVFGRATHSRMKEPIDANRRKEVKSSTKWDPDSVLKLNEKFELDPDAHVNKIRNIFTPAALQRKEKAHRYQVEIQLRRAERLKRQKAIEDEIRLRMRLEGIVLSEEEAEDEFPEFSGEEEATIEAAFEAGDPKELLVEEFRTPIHRKDIQTLRGLSWLNDEVINFYMNLVVSRGGKNGAPKVYAFNTFFYPKLMQGGHASLKRWTRKVDIFEYDKILVPVHLGLHWCLAVIDFTQKSIVYYDSLAGSNEKCLQALGQYLKDESLDKKKQPYDLSGWRFEHAKEIPEQMNGSDCGVFTCKFAEYVSRNAKITFTQEHMPYFRKKMVLEILNKRLL